MKKEEQEEYKELDGIRSGTSQKVASIGQMSLNARTGHHILMCAQKEQRTRYVVLHVVVGDIHPTNVLRNV